MLKGKHVFFRETLICSSGLSAQAIADYTAFDAFGLRDTAKDLDIPGDVIGSWQIMSASPERVDAFRAVLLAMEMMVDVAQERAEGRDGWVLIRDALDTYDDGYVGS